MMIYRSIGLLQTVFRPHIAATSVLLLLSGTALSQDSIEFLSGATAKGTVVEIRKQQREVVFASKIASRQVQQTYPYSKIHAVTYKGKRYVLNEKLDKAAGPEVHRSPKEIDELIERVGRTPPDWYDATPLDYPNTLDLSWPEPAPQPWNNSQNVGQYIWDRINPNESNWRGGIKLMHHLLTIHKDDAMTSRRVMTSLGSMYFRFFQDYPRAAFWWRQGEVSRNSLDGVSLAECYYQLGNKRMALEALDDKRLRVETIKLLGNMGETKRALQMAESYARQAKEPQWALLAAGDACRAEEDYSAAIGYYQRVVDSHEMRNVQYDRRARSRAAQSIEAIRQFELLDISKIKDGEYEAESLAYEGPLAVKVTVKGGRIADLAVTRHKEKQFYSALRDVPAQIIAKQSVKAVDATSRATITAEAIVSATAKALVGDVGEESEGRGKKSFR